MAGLIEKIAKTAITIKVPSGTFSDSQPVYAELPAKAFKRDMTLADMQRFGVVKSGLVFFVYGLSAKPAVPCKAIYEGECYDIFKVIEYRNMAETTRAGMMRTACHQRMAVKKWRYLPKLRYSTSRFGGSKVASCLF